MRSKSLGTYRVCAFHIILFFTALPAGAQALETFAGERYGEEVIHQLKNGVPGSVHGLSMIESAGGSASFSSFADFHISEMLAAVWYLLANYNKPFCEDTDSSLSIQEQSDLANGEHDCLIPLTGQGYKVYHELNLRGRGLKASGVSWGRLNAMKNVVRLQKATVNKDSGEISGDGKDVVLSEQSQASLVIIELQGDNFWLHDVGEINGAVLLPVNGVTIRSSDPNMIKLENTYIKVNEDKIHDSVGIPIGLDEKINLDYTDRHVRKTTGSKKDKGKTGSASTESKQSPGTQVGASGAKGGTVGNNSGSGDGGGEDHDDKAKKISSTHETDTTVAEDNKENEEDIDDELSKPTGCFSLLCSRSGHKKTGQQTPHKKEPSKKAKGSKDKGKGKDKGKDKGKVVTAEDNQNPSSNSGDTTGALGEDKKVEEDATNKVDGVQEDGKEKDKVVTAEDNQNPSSNSGDTTSALGEDKKVEEDDAEKVNHVQEEGEHFQVDHSDQRAGARVREEGAYFREAREDAQKAREYAQADAQNAGEGVQEVGEGAQEVGGHAR